MYTEIKAKQNKKKHNKNANHPYISRSKPKQQKTESI